MRHTTASMANSRALRLMLAVLSCLSGTGSAMVVAPTSTPGPSGLSRWLINTALASPLYKAVLVPQAKATMVKTAEKNGVPWTDALAWLEARGPWELPDPEQEGVTVPDYYREPFHAYESGNLCWEAALEGEIASREWPPLEPGSRPSADGPLTPRTLCQVPSGRATFRRRAPTASWRSAAPSTRH